MCRVEREEKTGKVKVEMISASSQLNLDIVLFVSETYRIIFRYLIREIIYLSI